MTSLIKNQVLKHLTKFFKDLAPEQLQLSAFKGSCELSNLQLEEKVLMDLLSFPCWVRINRAVCDQLSIKIPWTKIKSVPIQMNLNEVTVEVEICEEFRDVESSLSAGSSGENANEQELNHNQLAQLIQAQAQAPGKYGFVDRVIDGITVTVNNILIIFKSKLMSATFNLSRVSLESRCPNWKQGELSLTRIKDPKRGQILLFKVVDWQTMRLEAKCLTDPNQAPLRLITNHAQCRLTIKKSLEDCSMLAARIFVIFEDILWVLTFAQFTSAASFIEYVFSLIKRSPVSNKTSLLRDTDCPSGASHHTSPAGGGAGVGAAATATTTPLNASLTAPGPPLISPRNTPMHSGGSKDGGQPLLTGNLSSASLMEQKFSFYDLLETSLHLFIDKVDAHLYDDIEIRPTSGNASSRDSGGALQTTLDQIQVDCYPYSRANSDRRHWYRWFDPSPGSRKQWIRNHFAEFDLLKQRKFNSSEEEKLASNSKLPGGGGLLLTDCNAMSRHQQAIPTAADEQLLSLTVLVKVKEYCMNCVATNHSMRRGADLNRFIQTDKEYQMPADMPALYLELNNFYYFDATNRMMVYENVPDPLAFMHLSPTKLLFDSPTLVFLNSFHANLSKAFVHLNDLFPQETAAPTIQVRVEILMPQIILPAKKSQQQSTDNDAAAASSSTSSLLVKSGKITLCSSIYDRDVMSKLIMSIEKLKENPSQPINIGGGGAGSGSTPGGGGGGGGRGRDHNNQSCTNDWTRVWNSSLVSGAEGAPAAANNKLWAIQFEPVWMDFMNYDVDQLASSQRLEPIVEPVNAYAFMHLDLSSTFPPPSQSSQEATAAAAITPQRQTNTKRDVISILFTVLDGAILANMDKIQFGFLQRLGMHVEKLIQQVREDASSIVQMETVLEDTLEINLTGYVKEIKARLILEKRINDLSSTPASGDLTRHVGSGQATQSTPTGGYFNSLSSAVPHLSSSIVGGAKGADSFTSCSAAAYAPETPAAIIVEDGELLMSGGAIGGPDNLDDNLDECVEVADDASCMIFDESRQTNTAAEQSSRAIDIEEPSAAAARGSSNSLPVETSNTSLGGGSGSTRSVGKSPIEESLLINLDEIEQSSQLFAKMDVATPARHHHQAQPPPPPTPVTPEKVASGEQPTVAPETRTPSNQQQQDIETESISYLELSMSQLMVRRITETKRRQRS